MSENEFPTESGEQPGNQIDQLFEALESSFSESLASGSFITIRVESGPAIYVPLNEGEESISLRDAVNRRNLTLGPNVNAYVEGQQVPLETVVPAGTIVTMIGTVKGG
jgi:hypothetical protein